MAAGGQCHLEPKPKPPCPLKPPLSSPGNTFLAQWFTLGEFWSNLGRTLPPAQLCLPQDSEPCLGAQHGVVGQRQNKGVAVAWMPHRAYGKRHMHPFPPAAAQHVTARRRLLLLVTILVLLISSSIYILCCPPHCLHDDPGSGERTLFAHLLLHSSVIIDMVLTTTWGGLVARAAFLMSSQVVERTDTPSYSLNAFDSVKALQNWYNNATGLWDSTGWWNSGNCLTVVGDWAVHDISGAQNLSVSDIMANTFEKAQTTPAQVRKRISSNGLITSEYDFRIRHRRHELAPRGFTGFLNEFYDDEGWWALAWIRSWDVTHDQRYVSC
ncbi:hypothetical protein B0T16DRAFT_181862 [Cercophora newfieldiana]|uniref:Uncharacterized protein n=1 Tax=Cercophora newfieldiana TaxID=92897 RepID=A0AA39Y1L1_9PEZI|nr:hypothetical protein B0T16DRAFT_181862 [Cercophora newfieldiana]